MTYTVSIACSGVYLVFYFWTLEVDSEEDYQQAENNKSAARAKQESDVMSFDPSQDRSMSTAKCQTVWN